MLQTNDYPKQPTQGTYFTTFKGNISSHSFIIRFSVPFTTEYREAIEKNPDPFMTVELYHGTRMK